ncbi:AAA family ATPase [Variovorax sp. J22P271]|uniref:AAA family ATPase n=1 Tax=Variovorax davisae TaxID=3053515 RepID=UPI002574EA87|nr:AAA family ATPase [Variovorax sp. J22P271]MDM0031233.1 AAA family ATPase [Variovorax sp. J22P271]
MTRSTNPLKAAQARVDAARALPAPPAPLDAVEAHRIGLNGYDDTAERSVVFPDQSPRAGRLATAPIEWKFPAPISMEELLSAKLAPDEIIEGFLWADLALLIGSGGTGKTVWLLTMAVCIALGRAFFGHAVLKPGRTLFLTGEDPKHVVVAAIRQICRAMALCEEEIGIVLDRVRISDVTGGKAKLSAVRENLVVPSELPTIIGNAARDQDVVVVMFDPTISFAAGESRVNDSEQGIVESGRIVRDLLNCAVVFSHHTGQNPAKERNFSMYASRNGSALPDGCRMEWVMHRPDSVKQWVQLTGRSLAPPRYGFEMAVARCQYAAPPPEHYFFEREGHAIERVKGRDPFLASDAEPIDALDALRGRIEQGLNLLLSEFEQGMRHTGATAVPALQARLGVARQPARDVVSALVDAGLLVECMLPHPPEHGARTYLHPLRRGAALPADVKLAPPKATAASAASRRRSGAEP